MATTSTTYYLADLIVWFKGRYLKLSASKPMPSRRHRMLEKLKKLKSKKTTVPLSRKVRILGIKLDIMLRYRGHNKTVVKIIR